MKNLVVGMCLGMVVGASIAVFISNSVANGQASGDRSASAPAGNVDLSRLEDSKLRLPVIESVDLRRADEAAKLVGLLNSTVTSDDTKMAAAHVLGRERMVEGIRALVSHAMLRQSPHLEDEGPPWDEYPAFHALAEIGNPAIPALLEMIRATDDATKRDRSVRVIRVIEGADVARVIIAREVAKETDAVRKDRLQTSLSVLEKQAK